MRECLSQDRRGRVRTLPAQLHTPTMRRFTALHSILHAGDRERGRLWEVAGPTLTLGKPWCAAASRLRRRQTDTTPRKAGHMNRAFSNTKCLELLEIECSQSENGTLQCGAGPEWHGKPFFSAGHQRLDTCRCPLVASQQKTAKHQMNIESARSVS